MNLTKIKCISLHLSHIKIETFHKYAGIGMENVSSWVGTNFQCRNYKILNLRFQLNRGKD